MRLFPGLAVLAFAASAHAQEVAPATIAPDFTALPLHVGGRAVQTPDGEQVQWPGVYFDGSFTGTDVYLKLNAPADAFRVTVDNKPAATLSKPAPGAFHISGQAPGDPRIRVEKISEGGPLVFGGLYIPPGETARKSYAHSRQIEFVGDSLTLGYGNTSTSTNCTPDQAWAATDTSQAFPPVFARGEKADYQIIAASGRGLVRNFDGVLPGITVTAMYPNTLMDGIPYTDKAWRPQLVVIALGTNDFATPVHAGEKWSDDSALKADYEATYTAFIQQLRVKYPQAFFLLLSYDTGTVQAEVAKVVDRLKAAGETRVDALPLSGFAFTGCAGHLTTADDKKVASALSDWVGSHSVVFPAKADDWRLPDVLV